MKSEKENEKPGVNDEKTDETPTGEFSQSNEEKSPDDAENESENDEGDAEKSSVNENESSVKQHEDFSANEVSGKIHQWFSARGWKGNPFVLNIIPSVFVGYESQKKKLISCVEQKHKVCFIVGATGSGKTTALRWLADELKGSKEFFPIFLGKPPANPEEFVEIFNKEIFSLPWYLIFLRPVMPNIKSINGVSEALNNKFRSSHLVLLCDEIHEADIEVLQWMRVLADQVDNFSIVISGLPTFDDVMRGSLETFEKRITARIELSSLSEEETREMIEGRIKYVSKDRNFTNPFTDEAMKEIYRESGGFPREILRLCDSAINDAISKGRDTIIPGFAQSNHDNRVENSGIDLRAIPRRQREIIEAIRKGKVSPSEIIDSITMDKYKTKDHAIRSVNNILQRLMKDRLIDREKQGKTFIYALGPKLKSIAVRA